MGENFRQRLDSKDPKRRVKALFHLRPTYSLFYSQGPWGGKRVLVRVPKSEEGRGFYSSLFLVKKPNGSFRTIINLKPLNRFIVKEKFKMESINSAISLLFQGCFMVSIDLRDAYYHVPIHPHFQQYLRVAIELGSEVHHYQYQALPFGITVAPRIFTKIIAEVSAHLREREGLLIPYLDDFLLVGRSRLAVKKQLEQTLTVLQNLGWKINWEKSNLVPSQIQKFLGMTLDSTTARCFLPEEKVVVIQNSVRGIRKNPEVSVRRAMALLGQFTATLPAVEWAQIHSRPLQLETLAVWDNSEEGLEKVFSLSGASLESLRWWEQPKNLTMGKPWRREKLVVLTTDASPTGWGAHVGGRYFQGVWESGEDNSSNFRELRAVICALRAAMPEVRGKHLQVMSDNTTTVTYVNKQGGTRSKSLMSLAYDLFSVAEKSLLSISAVHIKGMENTQADFLSRHSLLASEWALNKDVFREITRIWGIPDVDLFATKANRQVQNFCSLDPMGNPWAVDALSVGWQWDLAYAFPPIPLVPRVLAKIREEGARVIMVAPFWPKRSWFSLLWSMSVTEPWVLPDRGDLLVQGPLAHPQEKGLHLTAWALKGSCSNGRGFLKK